MNLKKVFTCIFLFVLLSLCNAETPNEIAAIADEAAAAENWEKALSTLQDGIKQFPNDANLLLKLGIIYYDKSLYRPAYKIFKKGLAINKYNTELLFYASNASAALNKDEEALYYIKEYLHFIPDDRYAASNYGWLCFKCHKTNEGIDYLLKNIKEYGNHISVCNSLGTLYSEIFDYANAKKYYTTAIKLAEAGNKKYSASIYYYNKAILESQFYNFQAALDDAENALKMQERNSGYMIIGELQERKNNFSEALKAYLSASNLDDTPLANLSVVNTFLSTGNFENAEKYLLGIIKNTSEAWISNYGLSVNEFKSNIYDILKKFYKQKYNFEKTKLTLGFGDWIKTAYTKINYRLKYKYYDSVCRVYTLKVAKEYKRHDAYFLADASYSLHINAFYYRAFKNKGKKALKYFECAEKIETEFVPKSAGGYIAEKAIIEKDLNMLNKGISKMDPVWERQPLTELYAEGMKIAKNKSLQLYYLYSESLYEINPAAFLDYDIKLPIKLNLQNAQNIKIKSKDINSILHSSRFIIDSNSPFELQIKFTKDILTLKLTGKNGYHLFTKNFKIEKHDKTNFKKSVNEFVKLLFRVKL